ncbi:MAG: HlyD family efflux transporter periplasmic adaptor subunit [Ignavibacteria bacterium]|nr:HlyD family efflux transporter periplasmic adaptor subunit [Ignavibacteria bacterium]
MNKITLLIIILTLLFCIISCQREEKKADAYGNFEAIETIVSAEANGKVIYLDLNEGEKTVEGKIVAIIDTSQLYLKKMQLISQKKLVSSKFKVSSSQADVVREQVKVTEIEKQRIENLLKDNAASPKQLDDIIGSMRILEKQINSILSQNNTTSGELSTLDVQIKQINDQIEKCIVKNPTSGTVIMKLVELNEIVSFGKPLYKIANLEEMELRAYISGSQLSEIRIGQKVKVCIDVGKESLKQYEGEITWISSKAEFTPKIIQTKEERVNLVYAIKVKVKNDGDIKIGMPAEVFFN